PEGLPDGGGGVPRDHRLGRDRQPDRRPALHQARPEDRRMSAQAGGLGVAPRRRLRDNAVVVALRGSHQAIFGGAVLSVVILIALLAPWIAPYGEPQRAGGVGGAPAPVH